jgi:ankyrin repeat protein
MGYGTGGWAIDGEGYDLPRNELEAAAMNGNIEMIELLEEYSYPFNDVNVLYASGLATKHNGIAVMKYFLDKGFADVNFVHDDTLLSVVAQGGNVESVKLLLEYGARTDADSMPAEYGALFYACEWGNHEIAKLLIENGVSQGALTAALEQPTYRGYSDVVGLLVENGADIEKNWAIIYAAMRGSHILQYFIDQGIDINGRFDMGEDGADCTLLMVAVLSKNTFGIKALLEAGADTTLTNTQGQTALDIAKKTRNSAIIKMLEQYEGSGKKNSG